jgi:hypothetical protein
VWPTALPVSLLSRVQAPLFFQKLGLPQYFGKTSKKNIKIFQALEAISERMFLFAEQKRYYTRSILSVNHYKE